MTEIIILIEQKKKKYSYKCEHMISKYLCRICSKHTCEHGISKYNCFVCGGLKRCPHGLTSKSVCKKCTPKRNCEHGITKYACRFCFPNNYCTHGKYKYHCKICRPMKKNDN